MSKKTILAVALGLTLAPVLTQACTGILVKSEDGKAVAARTMEFGFDVKSNIAIVPAGTEITSLVNDPKNTGLVYTAKYGFGGANALDKKMVVDGVNEKGLYFGAFYFSGLAKFAEFTNENKSKAVSSEELGNYILGNFATVDEVIEGLKNIIVVGSYIDEIKTFAPFHYAVTDPSGRSIVIEYTEAGLQIHENKIGVVTNNPTYDWHIANLRNYIGLTPYNKEAVEINGVKITPTGEGSGLLGLPGDYTSPSRFVRAATFVNASLPSKTVDDAVFTAFHLLNAFDIPKGAIRSPEHEALTDYTVWTSVVDTANKDYYFKSYLTPMEMKVNIPQALKQIKEPTVVKMENSYTYKDITPQFGAK
ncbi:linear amide C-N hydrolase [Photobacterium damselae]|uniref:linear amide C-N hydrolase n=1 Tax=Photobacterium damselae TaxID=38293 RepID=UPI004069560A